MNTQEVEYIATTINNADAQRLFALVKQLDTALDQYVDSFEVPDNTDLNYIKPDAYHMTLVESTVKFSAYDQVTAVDNCECESVSFLVHDGYIAIDFTCDSVEDAIDMYVQNGAEVSEDDPVPYISVAKCQGEWTEEQWEDFIDWFEDEVDTDIKVRTGQIFMLSDKSDDWENNPDNFIQYD